MSTNSNERRTYEKLRDAYIVLQTEQASAIKNNAVHCEAVRKEVDTLLSLDTEIAEMQGIQLEFLRSLDFEKLVSESDYCKKVQEDLDAAMEKLCAILEGVLK